MYKLISKCARFAGAFATASTISACNTYPLPSDVIGISTEEIVVRVRCETRDAIRSVVLARIKDLRDEKVYRGIRANDLLASIEKGTVAYSSLDPDKFSGQLYKDFKRYRHAQISYDFTLQGIENNTQGAKLELARKFPGGRGDTIGFDSQAERTRDVKRNFRVFDDFTQLARDDEKRCEEVRHIDIVYPIGGEKRIDDLVASFLGLNQGQHLTGPSTDPITPAMADTITFTTKISGGISPGFALAPTGPGFSISSISFPNTNYRQDIHTLIISLRLPPDDLNLAGELKPGLSFRKYTRNQLRQISGNEALDQQRLRNVQDAVVQALSGARLN